MNSREQRQAERLSTKEMKEMAKEVAEVVYVASSVRRETKQIPLSVWALEVGAVLEAGSWVWFSHPHHCLPVPKYGSSTSSPSTTLPVMAIWKSSEFSEAFELVDPGDRRTQSQLRPGSEQGAPCPDCSTLNIKMVKELPSDKSYRSFWFLNAKERLKQNNWIMSIVFGNWDW